MPLLISFKLNQIPTSIYSVFTILSLVILFGGCASKSDNTVWHQHYEPVEDLQVLAFVQEAFAEAQNQYGKVEYSGYDIHIRQSVSRKNRVLLSRADVSNFSGLSRQIFFNRDSWPEDLIWNAFTAEIRSYVEQAALGAELSVAGQQQIVNGLNNLIESGKGVREDDLTRLNDLSDRKKYIRNFLDNHFLNLLLPLPEKRYVLERVEICECLTPEKGLCVLYVSAKQGSPYFFPQLAHEVFHLLSPQCYDWYVEGLSNVFSEEYCAQNGYSWQSMLAGFHARKTTDPYAISYLMMRDIHKIAGSRLANFMEFAVWSDNNKTKKHIDITGWLNTLPLGIRERVEKTIWSYVPALKAHKGVLNNFMLPQN